MIGSPTPPTPMSAASVAVPTLMIALVFTPAKIVREASGKKTFQKLCVWL